jgi:hypothetical protein
MLMEGSEAFVCYSSSSNKDQTTSSWDGLDCVIGGCVPADIGYQGWADPAELLKLDYPDFQALLCASWCASCK